MNKFLHTTMDRGAGEALLRIGDAAVARIGDDRGTERRGLHVLRPQPPTGGLGVRVDRITRRYGSRVVLDELDLAIEPGAFVAIVGRSGCGKSTLLRLLAGLETPDTGTLRIGHDAAASDRPDVRMMYQDARLLPWLRVLDNVALGLRGPDARARAAEALASVGLSSRGDDWPATLSGGQRQRVALARALVQRPRLLLLDEPLGALDALTRIEMHALIERLWRTHGFTALLVTHDVSEAVALADRIVLIERHRVGHDQAIDLPRPRDRGTAAFAAQEADILARVLHGNTRSPSSPTTPSAVRGCAAV